MTTREQMRAETKEKLVAGMVEAMAKVAGMRPDLRELALRASMRAVAAGMFNALDRSDPEYLKRAEAIVDAIVELGTDAATLERLLTRTGASSMPKPLPSTPPGRHHHAEAFMLMTYTGEYTARTEVIWNSRDGLTPFVIGSTWEPEEPMTHREWSLDRCVPTYVPQVGSRIFVDLTIERAREHARRTLDLEQGVLIGLAHVESLAQELMRMGTPDIVVVTEEIRERFQRAHDETLRDR